MKENKTIQILAIGVAISLVVIAVAGSLYVVLWKGPQDVARTTSEEIVDSANAGYELFKRAGKDIYLALGFKPKVVVGDETLHGPALPIAEVATAVRDFDQSYSYEVRWAGSTKSLQLSGEFTAKAGFVVDDSFALEVSGDGQRVTLRHKEPVLLSCELKNLRVLKDEDGWWNKLQADERASAQNALLKLARKNALDAGIKEMATRNLLERMQELQNEYSFELVNEVTP